MRPATQPSREQNNRDQTMSTAINRKAAPYFTQSIFCLHFFIQAVVASSFSVKRSDLLPKKTRKQNY
jgi:hypothetical protein